MDCKVQCIMQCIQIKSTFIWIALFASNVTAYASRTAPRKQGKTPMKKLKKPWGEQLVEGPPAPETV